MRKFPVLPGLYRESARASRPDLPWRRFSEEHAAFVEFWIHCGASPTKTAVARGTTARCVFDTRRRIEGLYGVKLEATREAPDVIAARPAVVAADPSERVLALLKKEPRTLGRIADELGISEGQALDACVLLKGQHKTISREGDTWYFHEAPVPAFASGERHVLMSDGNRFRFGVVSDSHLGSKYERLDALIDIYDRFEREGITHVYHCGNWIEGESRFNRSDISVFGQDAQLEYLAKKYPRKSGITTFAVSGDDHEGWYAQRESIDIGVRAEETMRRAGRTDWVNLGYMEAHVMLTHAETGQSAPMAVCHPGGGSAYAESYVVQKIIESLEGGEKPAVALYGHYHKALTGEYRNVFWVLVPSTKDQDVFMRKKRLRSVVGGVIVECEQNPEDGAIHSFKPWIWRYFNRGYYNHRWSPSGNVILPERFAR